MTVYLYARVSTTGQDTETQEQILTKAYPDAQLITEKASATTMNRPELNTLLKFLREGDKLVVLRIDRLARNIRDLLAIVDTIRDRGAILEVHENSLDTSKPQDNAFLQMLGIFAEFENALRKERQAAGIAKAKEAGKYTGRKRTVDREAIKRLSDSGLSKIAIAKQLGVGRATVYRVLDELKAEAAAL